MFRGGGGLSYAPVPSFNYITNAAITGVGFNQLTFPAPSFGVPTYNAQPGAAVQSRFADNCIAAIPESIPATPVCSAAPLLHRSQRGTASPNILQWSMGLQRQIAKGPLVEANYVGNRGAWENAAA